MTALGALTAARAEEEVVPPSYFRASQSQLRDAQRLLGKKTMEAEILEVALDIGGGQRTHVCTPSRRPRTVHDGGGLRSPRGFPIQLRGQFQDSSGQAHLAGRAPREA